MSNHVVSYILTWSQFQRNYFTILPDKNGIILVPTLVALEYSFFFTNSQQASIRLGA